MGTETPTIARDAAPRVFDLDGVPPATDLLRRRFPEGYRQLLAQGSSRPAGVLRGRYWKVPVSGAPAFASRRDGCFIVEANVAGPLQIVDSQIVDRSASCWRAPTRTEEIITATSLCAAWRRARFVTTISTRLPPLNRPGVIVLGNR